MTPPLLAVAAHRAIDRQQALITLLHDDPGLRFQLTAPGKREHALAFLEECRQVFMAQRHVETGDIA